MSFQTTTTADPNPGLGHLSEVTCVYADAFCISGSNGQIKPGRYQGLYLRDTRVLSQLMLRVNGTEPPLLHGRAIGPRAARFAHYYLVDPDLEVDPRIVIDRRRVVSESLFEEIIVRNFGSEPVTLTLELLAASDFAYIFDVKHGRVLPLAVAASGNSSLTLSCDSSHRETTLDSSQPPTAIDASTGSMSWDLVIPARSSWETSIEVTYKGTAGVRKPSMSWVDEIAQGADEIPESWRELIWSCNDERFTRLIARGVADLASLVMRDPQAPDDRYLAAGSPWFLTLFGRDSIWSAWMALPLDLSLAGETLRVLARRQGTEVDPVTEQAPGKILHEVRHGGLTDRGDLPPLYYGSMDSTPLFVMLAHEAWRWGLPEDEVRALMPAIEAALSWIRDYGDADGDGFLEYRRSGDRGLANQGWKDSGDAIQFADGRFAEPPIALCEVQGYAYAAMLGGAELVEHLGGDSDPQEWRARAEELGAKFRASFWVCDDEGPYPALALDGEKVPVDGVASNMGHLLMTGILNAEESAHVAHRLVGHDLATGWGLRTLSSHSARYNPLSYHGGSVWPHDTAIVAAGLARTGHGAESSSLLRGLVAASPFFDFRLPELFAGEQRGVDGFPLPYPAACRPQAWAAGSALLIARSLFGFEPDVPHGKIRINPIWPPPYPRVEISGVQVAAARLSGMLTSEGIWVECTDPALEIEVIGAPRLEERPASMTRS